MAIKSRFLLMTTLILLLTGFFSWMTMRVQAEDIIVSWVKRYAEKQVLYDKVRTLLPVIQEVELSKEFAELDAIKAWGRNPFNGALKEEALKEAEAFRHRFSDRSYFIALKGSEEYYYSDDELPAGKDPYRYTLHEFKSDDAWFYQVMAKKLNLHLNVNPDVELGVVKLWSDVLIRDGDEVLGVVGTGLDLSTFLQQILDKQDIYSAIVFTNYEGSIQLYQQEELINYSSLTQHSKDQKLVFHLLDDDDSRDRLQTSFKQAKATPNSVEMTFVTRDGVRQLASVVYIPEIDWFQVNFIDINGFLPLSEFSGLILVFLISLVCALVILFILLSVIVTKPLAELDRSITTLGQHHYRKPIVGRFAGLEIKRLVSHFHKISMALLEYQQALEKKVAERTQELDRIARLDPLTELNNRRGFDVHLNKCMKQWQQNKQAFAIINLDVDNFKEINDQYGHAVGDVVLQRIAGYLVSIVGDKGELARWGGDEFLILVKQHYPEDAFLLVEQLKHRGQPLEINIDQNTIFIEFSVGMAMISESDSLENLLQRADSNMYEEKFSSR